MPWKAAVTRVGKKLGSALQDYRTVIFVCFSKGIVQRRKNYYSRNKSGDTGKFHFNLPGLVGGPLALPIGLGDSICPLGAGS